MPKIVVSGWVEAGEEPKNNIPKICKYCGTKMKVTNALQLIRILLVWCPNSQCRWCLEFEE
jgi:hypothetical protein